LRTLKIESILWGRNGWKSRKKKRGLRKNKNEGEKMGGHGRG